MFTDAEKSELEQMQDVAFSSFAEEITIVQAPQKTYLSLGSFPANYNFAFDGKPAQSDVTFTIQTGVFMAVVEYEDSREDAKLKHVQGDAITLPQEWIRVCVSGESARKMMATSDIIIFDNSFFKIQSDQNRRGIFTRKYTDFWLYKTEVA